MVESYADEQVRPRRRRGRKVGIVLLILLVIVLIGLTVVDRWGASYAERQIADRVASQIAAQGAAAAPPEVSVNGFPFLTQVMAGNYGEITIKLRDLAAKTPDRKTVNVPLVDIVASDVRAPLGTILNRTGSIVATNVTGSATVDYASVIRLIDRPGVTLAERDGKLAVTAPLEFAGRSLTVDGTANLTVADGVVRIRFERLSSPDLAANPVAQGLINTFAGQLSVDLKMPKLPLNLTIDQVTAKADGLAVSAKAAEVPLNSGGF